MALHATVPVAVVGNHAQAPIRWSDLQACENIGVAGTRENNLTASQALRWCGFVVGFRRSSHHFERPLFRPARLFEKASRRGGRGVRVRHVRVFHLGRGASALVLVSSQTCQALDRKRHLVERSSRAHMST